MTLLLFYLFLAIGFSFVCSILEAVLLSMTPAYVSTIAQSGGRYGKILGSLKSEVDRPLAAILSLNTIAHTVGAAGVGAQAQAVFQSIPVSVVSGVLTLLILVLSEIIPKTLGATYWRELAKPSAYLIHYLTLLLLPFVLLSNQVSRLIKPDKGGPATSLEELAALAKLGHNEGVFDSLDDKMFQSAIHFQSVQISEILTPRSQVKFLRPEETIAEIAPRFEDLKHSRYPVLGKDSKIEGFVLRADLLQAAARDAFSATVSDFKRDVFVFPETAKVKHALSYFLKAREHLAVVVDEFGSLAGILTMEDVLEVLTGLQIVDELDEVESYRKKAPDA